VISWFQSLPFQMQLVPLRPGHQRLRPQEPPRVAADDLRRTQADDGPGREGLYVASKDAHWSALYREPMACDFVGFFVQTVLLFAVWTLTPAAPAAGGGGGGGHHAGKSSEGFSKHRSRR
jgi:hypothetical protein